MKVDSLRGLKAAFAGWRRGKRHVREAVPDELLERARRAAEVHGVKEVVRAIRVERSRLFRGRRDERRAQALTMPATQPTIPAFSRLELTPRYEHDVVLAVRHRVIQHGSNPVTTDMKAVRVEAQLVAGSITGDPTDGAGHDGTSTARKLGERVVRSVASTGK